MSKRQEEESLQPPAADFVDSGTQKRVTSVPSEGDEHFQGRTSSQRENPTPSPVQHSPGNLKPPVSGPQLDPQPVVLPETLAPQNSLYQGHQQQQQNVRDQTYVSRFSEWNWSRNAKCKYKKAQ